MVGFVPHEAASEGHATLPGHIEFGTVDAREVHVDPLREERVTFEPRRTFPGNVAVGP